MNFKRPRCIPLSRGSDTASFTHTDVEFFIWSEEMTQICCDLIVKWQRIYFTHTHTHFHPPLSLRSVSRSSAGHVWGVSCVFALARAQPSSLQASGALHKEKKSPTIAHVRAYPHWQDFIAEFILWEAKHVWMEEGVDQMFSGQITHLTHSEYMTL